MTHPLHQQQLDSLKTIPNITLHATRVTAQGAVEWCTEKEAGMFSVYVGLPGDYEWVADFADYVDACEWAESVQRCQGGAFIDQVRIDRE